LKKSLTLKLNLTQVTRTEVVSLWISDFGTT
jgi:hypothetical protein